MPANEVPNRANDSARQTALPNPDTSHHEVQIQKGKGKYKSVWSSQGQGLEAARKYAALNIGRGFSKRFVVDGKVTHRTTYSPLGE
jgi:hypothetical protein